MADINTNFFKLLYGSNYSKLNKDKDFKEAAANFDFTSIYDELAQESDDGVVKKQDLIEALQDEIEDLGLKTEDFDATDKSKYNTNEDTNISKLVNLFSQFDDESGFSSDDLEYLENMKVSTSGDKITLKDSEGDTTKTISFKRKSNQTISSSSSKDYSSSSTSSSKGSKKAANENILKLIYGKNYSKVKNESEIKKFDINEIYNELKKESGSSRIDEDDLVNAITDALYDLDDFDEETNVDELVYFLSDLDNKEGFSKSDLTSLKEMSVGSNGKNITLKNGDKYTLERDSDGQIDAFYEKDSSNSQGPTNSPIAPTPPSSIVQPSPAPTGVVQPSTDGKYPVVGQAPGVNATIEGYTPDKINNDKQKFIGYRDTINSAITKINESGGNYHKDITTISRYDKGLVGYTIDMGKNSFVHIDLENGKFKNASYYTINKDGHTNLHANVQFNENQLIQGIFVDEVDSKGKRGNNSFAETTAIFDAQGNLSMIAYDKNENKNAEVIANFESNNLSTLTLNKDDTGSDNKETYGVSNNGFVLQNQPQAPEQPQTLEQVQNESQTQNQNQTISQEGLKNSFEKNGITYAHYEKDGKTTYLKISGNTKIEITQEDFEKNKG